MKGIAELFMAALSVRGVEIQIEGLNRIVNLDVETIIKDGYFTESGLELPSVTNMIDNVHKGIGAKIDVIVAKNEELTEEDIADIKKAFANIKAIGQDLFLDKNFDAISAHVIDDAIKSVTILKEQAVKAEADKAEADKAKDDENKEIPAE